MLTAYHLQEGAIRRLDPERQALSEATWIDLWHPTPEEIAEIDAFGIRVPSQTALHDIELSRRLYRHGDVDYMTLVVPQRTEDGHVMSMPVACILSAARLVTVRHGIQRPLQEFVARQDDDPVACDTPDEIFLHLVDMVVADVADQLEDAGRDLNEITLGVFGRAKGAVDLLQRALQGCGRMGGDIAKIRQSLLVMTRVLSHFEQRLTENHSGKTTKAFLKTQQRDVVAMAEHADHLSERVSFATDATLGMINLDQNRSVSALSAVAVLFLPATLIASIYGMNFDEMPGLKSQMGYFAAISLMVLCALGGLAYLKWRKWI